MTNKSAPPNRFTNLKVTRGLTIDGTAITATPAELNTLSGVTATAAELNKVDGRSPRPAARASGRARWLCRPAQHCSTSSSMA
jgi:hypothetical protein